MREFRFDRLVSDGVADNIIVNSYRVKFRILNDEETLEEAKKRLAEEVQDLQKAEESKIPENLANIQELIDLIYELKGINKKIGETERVGAFKRRLYIETVGVTENSKLVNDFLSQPEKYPEVKQNGKIL
jgi:predicted house-cleaning noncanonical NTP pyrophosphatase (MazG superfamily)